MKDDELLEKCNEIQEKVKNSTKKEFDSEAVQNAFIFIFTTF